MAKKTRVSRIAGLAAALAALTLTAVAAAQPTPQPSLRPAPGLPDSVAAFVRADFHHGITYEAARSYGPPAVPELLTMLERDEEREHWSNVLSVLGMIGDPRATEPMIEFLERRFSGEVDPVTYGALLQVVPSLGFLARDPTGRAFGYLREGTSLATWRNRKLAWTFPALRGAELEILMVKLDILGLGISATEASRDHLRTLRKGLDDDRDGLRSFIETDVGEALRTAERLP